MNSALSNITNSNPDSQSLANNEKIMKHHATLDELVAQAIAAYSDFSAPTPATLSTLDAASVARLIDHTLLKPDATSAHIRKLCDEAKEFGFWSVCVHPSWAPYCLDYLQDSAVKICTVVGFPLGATLPAVKAFEAEQVTQMGVQEVDMVLNVGRLKDQDYRIVHEDVAVVADAAHENGALLKVIIETGLLTLQEKIAASFLCKQAGADFVKTSTGFNGGGATAADIALMRAIVGSDTGVKASGGVRTAQDALTMIAAGASRIGTSGGMGIVRELAGAAISAAKGDGY